MFSPATVTVTQGELNVAVFGTLTNISGDTVYVNSDSLTVPGASSIADDFLNTPPSLGVGQRSGLIELFSFDLSSNAALGSLDGTYAILGGIGAQNARNFDPIGTEPFTVTVEPVLVTPEPGTLILLATGLLSFALLGLAPCVMSLCGGSYSRRNPSRNCAMNGRVWVEENQLIGVSLRNVYQYRQYKIDDHFHLDFIYLWVHPHAKSPSMKRVLRRRPIMRKSLWIIPFLFAAIGAPTAARADGYLITFNDRTGTPSVSVTGSSAASTITA
jgi:hypothetical protein